MYKPKPHGDIRAKDEEVKIKCYEPNIVRRNLFENFSETLLVDSDIIQTTSTEKTSVPILYYHQYSYQAQRVLMVLYERNINFKSRILNLKKLEQYDGWFLKLSPGGEQPILVDNLNIVSDASKIIDYLEIYHSKEKNALQPRDKDQWEVEHHFRHIIDKLPESTLTFGTFYFPELIRKPKGPFRSVLKKILIKHDEEQFMVIKQRIEMYPNYRNQLMRKLTLLEHRKKILSNVTSFMEVVDLFNSVLDEIEAQLTARFNAKKQWLVGNQITKADISLVILLDRLNNLGLEHMFWKFGKRPNIEKYFQRMQKYPSYIKTKPTPWANFLFIITNDRVVSGLLALGIISAFSVSGFVAYSIFKKLPLDDLSIFSFKRHY